MRLSINCVCAVNYYRPIGVLVFNLCFFCAVVLAFMFLYTVLLCIACGGFFVLPAGGLLCIPVELFRITYGVSSCRRKEKGKI